MRPFRIGEAVEEKNSVNFAWIDATIETSFDLI
jgi:hypothetical protein